MILPIVQYGDPVLRQKCAALGSWTPALRALADDMLETMLDANGVGLAAPQIGRLLRLAVIDVSHTPESQTLLRVNGRDAALESLMPLVFADPEIEPTGPRVSEEEGCLSIRDIRAQVTRPGAIRARLTLPDNNRIELETDGLLARAVQHETDHLNGILFVDRISPAVKVGIRRRLRALAAETAAAALVAVG